MKKFFAFFGLLGMILSGIVRADGPTIDGYFENGRPLTGGQVIECQKDGVGIVVTVRNLVLIRTPEEGAKGKVKDLYTDPKTMAQAYRYFETGDDGTAYALKLGALWSKKIGVALDDINPDLDNDSYHSKASVRSGDVTFKIQPKAGRLTPNYYAFNVFHRANDGTHAWGGVEGSVYTSHNMHGRPLLLVGRACQTPTEKEHSLMATVE